MQLYLNNNSLALLKFSSSLSDFVITFFQYCFSLLLDLPYSKIIGKETLSVFMVKEFDKKKDEYNQKTLKQGDPY